jgi:hypothetical protein
MANALVKALVKPVGEMVPLLGDLEKTRSHVFVSALGCLLAGLTRKPAVARDTLRNGFAIDLGHSVCERPVTVHAVEDTSSFSLFS